MQTDSSIEAWLDTLASDAPTPGGGAAAALAGAMAAALVTMICRFTIGRPKYAHVQAEIEEVLRKSELLRKQLEDSIEADVQAYGEVVAARKMARDTPQAASIRNGALQASLSVAAGVPLETARLASEIVGLASIVAEKGNRNLISDASVAVTLAVSSAYAAAANVRANLPYLTDEMRIQDIAGTLASTLDCVESQRRAAMTHLEQPTI